MSFELDTQAHDHARSFQQGSGNQYNVDRGYFETRDSLPPTFFTNMLGSLVRESDPLELGVHRAAILNGNAVPAYVPRDIDDELAQKVEKVAEYGGLVIVVGDSTAGKSRAVYEALMHIMPEYRIITPYDKAELREAFALLAMTPDRVVLWLDDIEKYLGSDGLTPRIVTQLKRIKIPSVGTIRTEQYRGLTSLSGGSTSDDSRRHNELIALEHVLNHAELVTMQRRWTSAEETRAKQISDLRVAEALQHNELYGVAEYLAAGPKLFGEWSLASAVGASPRGAALVSAAIDCYRAGLHDFVPVDILRLIHEHYLEEAGGTLLRPESFEDALSWATQRRYGVTSLLLPGKQSVEYRAFDYITDRFMAGHDVPLVPEIVWGTIRDYFSEDMGQLNQTAIAAATQDAFTVAESIWRSLIERGSAAAANNMGILFLRTDRHEEAEKWYKIAAELGASTAATSLGHLLEARGKLNEAESWYERAALGDDAHGMYHMAIICQNRSNSEEAEQWFRRAFERKEAGASSGLGELLVSSGRLEEAESLLRVAADKGDLYAKVYLGVVLNDLKRKEEAEQLWLEAAEAGSPQAKLNLAVYCDNNGRKSEAEGWFAEAIAAGEDEAIALFSIFLAKRGQWQRAQDFAHIAFNNGNLEIGIDIAEEYRNAGRFKEAEAWMRKTLDAGETGAVRPLAGLLDRMGSIDEAELLWRRLVDEGDTDASFALAKIRLANGAIDEAIPLFEKAAIEENDATAACELGRIYWKKDSTLAEEWLQKSLAQGHAHAACLLGTFYAERGEFESAEQHWVEAYNGGHTHTASELSTLLASQGRGREAATWLRRSKGGFRKASSNKRSARSRRRR